MNTFKTANTSSQKSLQHVVSLLQSNQNKELNIGQFDILVDESKINTNAF